MSRRPDLVVEGNLLLESGPERACLGIDEDTGRIMSIRKTITGGKRFSYSGGLVVPAAVDLHVHFREPGLTRKEDLASGSRAALHGGVVRAVEMPNTKPPTTDRDALSDKRSRAKAKSVIDLAVAAGLTRSDPPKALLDAPFLKAYLGASTGGLLFPEEELSALASHLVESQYDGVVVFHAESAGMIADDAVDLPGHDAARPAEAELRATEAIVNAFRKPLAQEQIRVHMAHCSTSRAAAPALAVGITAGATPHHLFLDTARDLGTRGKVNPPLRGPQEREALWDRFADADLMVESDHAPHLPEEKDVIFPDAPAGVPGVETMVPLLMARVFSGELRARRMIEAVSLEPSRLLGPRLGLVEGREASLAFYRRRDMGPLEEGQLVSKAGWSPFGGLPVCFPYEVLLRGGRVVEEGEVTATPGSAVVW